MRYGAIDRGEIARELEEADSKRTNGDKWVIEMGFWIALILFLFIAWVFVGGFSIGTGL